MLRFPVEKRVLVVDDDAATRVMVAVVLKHEAFAVDVCEDGQQALVRLEQNEYGVVVLSLVRADPAGDANVLIRLKEKEKPPCVVVISAGSQTAMEAMASDLIRARLRKPFGINELVSAVRGCFDN